MRTAIYGGTFNPIHSGHIHLFYEMQQQMSFDRLFIIPTNVPPHKQEKDIASASDRINMCKIALKDAELDADVLDIEIKRMDKSYTVDTLSQLHELYPEDKFFLIMGEDMFMTLDRWYKFEEIIKKAEVCAAVRSSDGEEKMKTKLNEYEKLGAKCHLQNIEFLDISSTQIRERIQTGKSISSLVPKNVEEYILSHRLYTE